MSDTKPTYKYARYLQRVTRAPWCLLPEKMAEIRQLMALKLTVGRLSDQEILARLGDEEDRAAEVARKEGAIAVIPVHGTIAYRADSFYASSGGVSAELVGRRLDMFAKDDTVKAIVMDFDSPGGSVEGVPELGAKIAQVNKQKPVFAIANSLAASAAYWLATQAEELSVIPSGQVGSIGVYMLLVDETGWLAKEGITINAISAGDNKLEGAWFQELSEESRAHFQGQVDTVYGQFLKAVAAGRGVTVADVKKSFGQGRVYDAKEALQRGMVDRIETLDQLLKRLMTGTTKSRGRAAAAVAEQLEGGADAELPETAATADLEDGEDSAVGAAAEEAVAAEELAVLAVLAAADE